jgi:hypothetical protein
MLRALQHSWLRYSSPLLPQLQAHNTQARGATALAQASMKAVTYEKPGGLEVLQYVEVERPTPGQVNVRRTSMARVCQQWLTWHWQQLHVPPQTTLQQHQQASRSFAYIVCLAHGCCF